MDKEEKEVTLEDLYWATLSKNDIIRILKDNCSKNIVLEKQIADLEAKLAESKECKNQMLFDIRQVPEEQILDIVSNTAYQHNPIQLEIEQLKQQLAEKDAELNRYAELFGMKDKDFYVVEKNEYDKMVSGAKQFARKTAIAELEKVIKFMKTRDKCGFLPEQMSISEYVNQQIKNLKGER